MGGKTMRNFLKIITTVLALSLITPTISANVVQLPSGGAIVTLFRQDITNERLAEMVINGEIPQNTTTLNIGSSNTITDLSPLKELTVLQNLGMSGHTISDLSPLTELTNLNTLHISSTSVSDLTPLANLTNLGKDYGMLALNRNPISDLTGLENLTNLGVLELNGNQITDVTPLANLTDLWHLDLRNNNIECVAALAWLTKLDERSLMLAGNPVADNPEALRELAEARARNQTRTTLTLGHVLGYRDYQIEDALAILRYTIGLPSVLDDCDVARMAALVISSEVEGPQIADALEILRYVIGLGSVLENIWRGDE
jgi:Leucine-rich repeat (LRR) protein